MYKAIITLTLLIHIFTATAQRLVDRSGTVTFFSNAPLEDITAINNQALAALDLDAGKVAVSMLMRGFKFEKALMEEHFNENYVQSEKYPKASFTGTMDSKPSEWPSNGGFTITVTGEIELHGVKRPLVARVDLENAQDMINAKVKFPLKLADFNIRVPKAVMQNIAEEVEVTGIFKFKK